MSTTTLRFAGSQLPASLFGRYRTTYTEALAPRRRTPASEAVADRLGAHIKPSRSGCWLWTGPLSRGLPHSPATGAVHRWMFEAVNGDVPRGHHLHHRCHKHTCVNPDHLEVVRDGEHNVVAVDDDSNFPR
ncbi:MAG: hypothetical protein HKN41_08615 [Ilumatobacter sp.]|nr:hypothetical protein [Ilumatobacter sp.]